MMVLVNIWDIIGLAILVIGIVGFILVCLVMLVGDVFEQLGKWVKDNPEKTMMQDFLEKYPKAMLDERGLPKFVCPHYFGYDSEPYCATGHSDCVKCWNRPLED